MSDCNCGKAKVTKFATGAVKLAKAELGIGMAEAETIARRRAACEACSSWDHGKCSSCGCYTWAKTRLTRERCPLDKW